MDLLLVAGLLSAGLLLVILGLAVLLYAVPVRSVVGVTVSGTGHSSTRITASWLIVGVRVIQEESGGNASILIGSREVWTVALAGRKEPAPVPQEPGSSPVRESPVLPAPGRIARAAQRLLPPLSSLGSVLWKESRLTEIRGRVTLGLGDPVLTGEFYGYYWACRFILEAFRVHIEVEPDFDREIFACDLTACLTLSHPLLVILAALRLALHPAARDLASAFTSRTPGGAPA
jgi:hypothetical protein